MGPEDGKEEAAGPQEPAGFAARDAPPAPAGSEGGGRGREPVATCASRAGEGLGTEPPRASRKDHSPANTLIFARVRLLNSRTIR